METKLSEKYEDLFAWLSADKKTDLGRVHTVVMTGGRFSQKSYATSLFSCVAAKDYNHRVLYTRYTLTSAHDSIIPAFTSKLDLLNSRPLFDVRTTEIKGKKNDSKIVFKGIKTSSGNLTANLKSLENFSMLLVEEAEEVPDFKTYDKIRKSMRAIDVRNLGVLVLNPASKEHWIYKEYFEKRGVEEGFNGIKGNVLYVHTCYLDVEREYIPDDIWEEYEEKRRAFELYDSLTEDQKKECDPEIVAAANYYKHVVYGGWLGKSEGVIYENWKYGDFQEVGPVYYGQDFGFSNDPTTLVKVCVDKAQKRIYLKELLYKTKLTTSQIIELDKALAGTGLIIADSAEPRLIFEVQKAGINIKPAQKPPGSLTAGIKMLEDFTIIVDPGSLNLAIELNNYIWLEKKSKTPIDKFNHLLDPSRYVLYAVLTATQKGARGG
ncbi:PBSX family phage terminase large subunit [Dyadobacter sp. CY351]|uniref:PBSX family phage terminase large subunit n=1 Tax=Dyadobacter sp. CY351 TaxID=2909337 RepID=UPI001F32C546|nr:phage terminase large subunit [Dyadobacter sp. CY351]MCF2517138.1 phage terminase large subunit [Dyadobacter sp. CY351]